MKLLFIAIVFQNNRDSYRVCRGRNMPPFYSYEKLALILSVTILVKRGPAAGLDILRRNIYDLPIKIPLKKERKHDFQCATEQSMEIGFV